VPVSRGQAATIRATSSSSSRVRKARKRSATGVRSLGVVDDEAERAGGGEIRAEPVGPWRIANDGSAPVEVEPSGAAPPGSPSRPAATPAAACKAGALRLAGVGQRRGSNSWRTTPKANSCSSSVPWTEGLASRCRRPRPASQRGAPSCRFRPALRRRRRFRDPHEPGPVRTRSARALRSVRAARSSSAASRPPGGQCWAPHTYRAHLAGRRVTRVPPRSTALQRQGGARKSGRSTVQAMLGTGRYAISIMASLPAQQPRRRPFTGRSTTHREGAHVDRSSTGPASHRRGAAAPARDLTGDRQMHASGQPGSPISSKATRSSRSRPDFPDRRREPIRPTVCRIVADASWNGALPATKPVRLDLGLPQQDEQCLATTLVGSSVAPAEARAPGAPAAARTARGT
jgi:hypothetical protein